MIINSNYLRSQRSLMIIALGLILNHSVLSRELIISSGTNFIANNGNIVLQGNVVNDGFFINNNSTVIFAGTIQSLGGTSPVIFNNLTIVSGSTTTMTTAGQSINGLLLCNGTLNANGNITLLSTASQTALIVGSGSGQINGNVTIQRYLSSGFGYKYFSSPFQTATVSEFGDDMDLSAPYPLFYSYDESSTSSGWVSYIAPQGVLNPITGYAVNFGSSSAAIYVDVTGVVNNGSLSTTLYNHNNTYTKGFNLIGNPYPSPIDWDASSGWTKTGIDNTLYYFKASNTDQHGGTYSTYLDGVSSDSLATNLIPSMQGFFVHVSDGAWPVTAQLAMNNSVRVTNQSQPFIKGQKSVSLLRFTASFLNNLSSPDYSVVYFDPKATNEFDGKLDALKLMNTDLSVPNVYVLTPDHTKTSIKALPYAPDTAYSIPLGLKINKAGDVIFKIRDIEGSFSEMRISIIDKMIGIEQDLLNNQEYKISLNAGEYENRFFLNLSDIETGIDVYCAVTDLFSIYSSHGILKAEINSLPGKDGTFSVFNLIGQILFIKKVYQPGYHEFNPGLKDGLYIVSYISGTKRSSKKIFIHDQ